AVLWDKPGDPYVSTNDWNTYEIVAVGGRIRTAINGHLCVDVDDPKVARHGITGLQMHAGGPLEVRFRDLRLELNPKFELITAARMRYGNREGQRGRGGLASLGSLNRKCFTVRPWLINSLRESIPMRRWSSAN